MEVYDIMLFTDSALSWVRENGMHGNNLRKVESCMKLKTEIVEKVLMIWVHWIPNVLKFKCSF